MAGLAVAEVHEKKLWDSRLGRSGGGLELGVQNGYCSLRILGALRGHMT